MGWRLGASSGPAPKRRQVSYQPGLLGVPDYVATEKTFWQEAGLVPEVSTFPARRSRSRAGEAGTGGDWLVPVCSAQHASESDARHHNGRVKGECADGPRRKVRCRETGPFLIKARDPSPPIHRPIRCRPLEEICTQGGVQPSIRAGADISAVSRTTATCRGLGAQQLHACRARETKLTAEADAG